LPAVVRGVAPFPGEFSATGEKTRGAGSEPMSILVDGGLKFGEDRPCFVRAFRGHSFSTEFADAIIEATSARSHRKNPVSGQDSPHFEYHDFDYLSLL
jgi:hypothetical protein